VRFRADILPRLFAGTRSEKTLEFFLLVCSLLFLCVFTWQAYQLTDEATNVSLIFA
jgi:TRAP-type C4-dicarboxylate transport system permease small subunit